MRVFTPSAISRVNHRASYTNDDEGKDKKRNSVLHNNILLAQLGTGHKSSAPMKTRWDRARRYKLPVGVQRPNHLWTGTARSREFDYRDRGLPGGKENSAHFRLRNQKYYLESVGYGGDSVSQLALMQKLFSLRRAGTHGPSYQPHAKKIRIDVDFAPRRPAVRRVRVQACRA
jgi:hypothetical protein